MSLWEKHPGLQGRSVLLVESEALLGEMFSHCFLTEGMKPVDVAHEIPEDLLSYLERRKLDGAIIHSVKPEDLENILTAHRAGKNIIVLTRAIPIDRDEANYQKALWRAGVPTAGKEFAIKFFNEALGLLAEALIKS